MKFRPARLRIESKFVHQKKQPFNPLASSCLPTLVRAERTAEHFDTLCGEASRTKRPIAWKRYGGGRTWQWKAGSCSGS